MLRANTEVLLERIRANGKQQAADAAYQLSLAAAGRRDLDAVYSLIKESTQLAPEQAVYQQTAAYVAYSLKRFVAAIEHSQFSALGAHPCPPVKPVGFALAIAGYYSSCSSDCVDSPDQRSALSLPGEKQDALCTSSNCRF